MALATYADLKASIAAWLFNRTDLTAVIPDFIRLAEAQMDGEVRHRSMLASTAITFGGEWTDLPADFRGVRAVADASRPLVYATPEQLLADKLAGDLGCPSGYSIVGAKLQVWPAPAVGAGGTLVYLQAVPQLTADGDSNWLLARYPNAYLYGALMQAAPYLADDGRVQTWAAGFAAALAAIADANTAEAMGGVSIRPGVGVT